MRLKKLTLENFKCFHAPTEFEFGKLTLLTGANSSGKSSIIYAILGAIQSGEFPLQFSTNGKYVNMGDFRDVVFNHDVKEKIRIGMQFDKRSNSKKLSIMTTWEEDDLNKLPKLFEIKVSIDEILLFIKPKGDRFIIDFDYNPELSSHYRGFRYILPENDEIMELLSGTYNIIGLEVMEIPIIYLNEERNKKIINLYINEIRDSFITRFDNLTNFISSFRLNPERTYFEHSKTQLRVNFDGEGYLDQIIFWESKRIDKFSQLIQILKDLDLINDVKSQRLGGGRYEMSVQVREGGVYTSLSDVGFGVSQFMPIIVADLQLPDDSTLFVAQPEIHLHPSIQSLFGDYLTKQIREHSKNYVIETHSEYLLNKIRLAIVKKEEIKEEDVKIYFVDAHPDGNKIHPITFNKKGQILGAPENFFKTYMMDVMEIAINAAE